MVSSESFSIPLDALITRASDRMCSAASPITARTTCEGLTETTALAPSSASSIRAVAASRESRGTSAR